MILNSKCVLTASVLTLFCSLSVTEIYASDQIVPRSFTFHHEYVLGTSLELTVKADSADGARSAEQEALRQIDRLNSLLSSYMSDSEWSKLVSAGATAKPSRVSPDLRKVIERAEHWRQQTGGAFDIRTASLVSLWKRCAEQGRIPTQQERHSALKVMHNHLAFDASAEGVRITTACELSIDGIAKGYVLDAVAELILQQEGVSGCCVNIGGDIRLGGDMAIDAAIEDPRKAYEGARAITSVTLQTDAANTRRSLCTSGDYRRFVTIEGKRYSHIIDPLSGLPVDHVCSVSVLAGNATDADALATALSVMPVHIGLELVDRLPNVDCLLVRSNGQMVASSHWPEIESQPYFVADKETKAAEGLIVEFQLNRPKGTRYRRPYVAVWLEDSDGFPVKTAVLWMQTEQPGPRWHRDLTRWYRNDRMRKAVEKNRLIGTISGATRGPGEYQAVFDGTDNAGELLAEGDYTLCLEVAREHGTYQLIREKLKWTGKPIELTKLKGNIEMTEVSYKLVPSSQHSEKDANAGVQ